MARSVALAGAIIAAGAANAQTITVNVALDDYMDFAGAQTVADLPGPDGNITLREAVTAANNTLGAQTIAFAIPVSEWTAWYSNQVALIRLDNMLYVSDNDTTLDFTTQTAFTGDTNPNGSEVALHYAGVPASIPSLWLAADNCIIKGLGATFGNNFSNGIWITGNHNRVIGCVTGGLTIRGDLRGGDFNIIGGTAPGEGNSFSEAAGIFSGASNNVIVGNIFRWGLRINGDTLYGTCDNNRVGGPSDAERNNLAGKGYYGEEGFPTGTQLEVQHALNTVIENNFVGTTPDGSAKLPGNSGTGGIAIYTGAVGTIVRDNLISGIAMTGINHAAGQRFGIAIGVGSTATGTVITGNRIGVAANGVTPILNVAGIVVYSDPNGIPTNTRVGGQALGEGNLIANNETTGIRVLNSAVGARLSGNSIVNNGALGIDLLGFGPAGVTPNDNLDADTGGNNLQNFPIIASASSNTAGTHVVGSLDSIASAAFTIEFFSSPSCDASGNGEGEVFIGSTTVTTNAAGNASFDVTLAGAEQPGRVITATAADANGNTSEFSACASVISGLTIGDANGDGQVNVDDLIAVILGWGQCPAAPTTCPGDVDHDLAVDVDDLITVILNWS